MKYARLVVVFLTLTPCLVYAQNQPFSDCRTLAMAGNFVGADEALVDGLVCKVGKRKTSAAADKAADGSQTLLGIIEPEVLRPQEKAGANPQGREATGGATPESVAKDFAPSSSFFTSPGQSLGEIARAFRKEAGVAITSRPEPELEGNKPEVEAMAAQIDEAPAKEAVTSPMPTGTTDASSLPGREAARTTAGTTATARQVLPSTPEATRQNKTTAVPQAPTSPAGQETSPGAARNETAVKYERGLPAVEAKSSGAPDVEAEPPAATPAPSPKMPTSLLRANPGAGATAGTPMPERLSTPVVFASSLPAATAAQPRADRMEEDAPFREGQATNCNKNVSLGSMDKDKLFLAIPDWALQWFEKNRKRFPRICFSDSLMPGAKNYLVVFLPLDAPGSQSFEKVSSRGETTGASETGGFSASYGSTWHYTHQHTVTTTIVSVSAEKAPHNQPSTLLDAVAYSEEGTLVSHHSGTPGATRSYKGGKGPDVELSDFPVTEELLSHMMEDIAKL